MDVVGLVLDVGPSMANEDSDGVTHLDNCKNIMSMFLQRKIFSSSSDRVCLFNYGSEDTANELASDGDYQHISMERDLRPVDWELCQHVQNHIEPSGVEGDFIDALVVVSTYLMDQINSIEDKTVKKKLADGRVIIMLFSNLDNEVQTDSLQSIIQGFKDNNIEIHVIGPSFEEDSPNIDAPMDDQPSTSRSPARPQHNRQTKPKTEKQLKSESIVQDIISELDGCAYGYREALAAVASFDRKKKSSMPWNADLVLGSKLKIPISAYKKVVREPLPTFKQCYAKDPNQLIEKRYDTYLPDGMDTEVEKEDIIKGYRYGTDLVPFTEDDMANMKYKCDSKDFSIIGFTKASNVKRHFYCGKDTMILAAQKGDPVAATALSALTRALYETDSVAIVRRVYRANSAPYIGTLVPIIEENHEFMCYAEIPFMEDVRELEFPSLPTGLESGDRQSKSVPTTEQMNAVDDLMTSMDMTSEWNDEDDFLSDTQNPTMQRLFQVLAAKALDETCDIPEVNQTVSHLINNTTYTSRWSAESESSFANLFKLEKVSKSKDGPGNIYKDSDIKVNTEENGDTSAPVAVKALNKDPVNEIRSQNPVDDFLTMIDGGREPSKVFVEMAKMANQLIVDSVGTAAFDKALACIQIMRSQAIKLNNQDCLKAYNDSLLSLKSMLSSKGPKEFWKMMVQERVTLISNAELPSSDVTPADKDDFLSTNDASATLEKLPDGDDDEDMLDLI